MAAARRRTKRHTMCPPYRAGVPVRCGCGRGDLRLSGHRKPDARVLLNALLLEPQLPEARDELGNPAFTAALVQPSERKREFESRWSHHARGRWKRGHPETDEHGLLPGNDLRDGPLTVVFDAVATGILDRLVAKQTVREVPSRSV